MTKVDFAIVGAGFYGLYLAEYLGKLGHQVMVIDAEACPMSRASFVNQARVHNGYHYPRSVLTALRSRQLFPRFVDEFSDCIHKGFDKYYLIGRPLGNVSARQFEGFCRRIGAQFTHAPDFAQEYCDEKFIESAYRVKEFAFDSVSLRDLMLSRISNYDIALKLNTQVVSVQHDNGLINLYANDDRLIVKANQVFNCTYSRLNGLVQPNSSALIPLKHELTEICLVDVPEELKNVGVTVMCGPFFSFMPFPSTNQHSFTHVRYTPHRSWSESVKPSEYNAQFSHRSNTMLSAWSSMMRDASKFMPIVSEMSLKRSLFEIKTILPASETTDSRPILFRQNHLCNGFHSVMGGKIDNVYDIVNLIKSRGLDK